MAAERYDAVVVGAGHNGLVTAAYLAKAGPRTLVLERRSRAGGPLATEELAPGVRAPLLADGVGGLQSGVVADLGLRAHGFHALEPDTVAWAPSTDGTSLTLWRDPVRTATELRARPDPRDAEAFLELDRRVRSLAGFVARLQASEPPDLGSPSLADAGTGVTLLNALRRLGREQLREALRVLPMSVADLVGEAVEDELLRGVLGVRGVRYSAMGPRSAGTALNFLWDSAAGGGAAGRTVFARGGPDALVNALLAAARRHGATVRCDAEVAAIRTRDGAVEGVALASGEEIDAGVVASSADPKRTLLGLLDPAEVGPTLGWRAEHIRAPGVVAKVTLVLDGLPTFGGADEERLRGRIVVAPSLDHVERAFNDSKYGRISGEPYLEASIPSLSDPSLAPEGTHVMGVLFQYAPHDLREAAWNQAANDRVADAAVRTLEVHAPGLTERIVARRVVTPAELEQDYGLSGGHPMHGEHALDQFFAWRPLLGHARYRLAGIRGLYLCGAGAHPGGGITGGPGRNAARAILADLPRTRRLGARRSRPSRVG
ncbi:MAG TPA: NAD(P)/FAD-dependent oxidoreductase [Gaiellaceae bacterium]|nr:NAD(P)/FAD-dependent oxidoreductase [Gaiellaceae bacterium]